MKPVLCCTCLILMLLMTGCGANSYSGDTDETGAVFKDTVIEIEDGAMPVKPDGDSVFFEPFYEMSDGTYRTEDGHSYKYLLEITGGDSAAEKNITYLYLSNIETISYERAVMASGLGSNMNDYFDENDAKFIGMK